MDTPFGGRRALLENWALSLTLVLLSYMNICLKRNRNVLNSVVTMFNGEKWWMNPASFCCFLPRLQIHETMVNWYLRQGGPHDWCVVCEVIWKGPHGIVDQCLVIPCDEVILSCRELSCVVWNTQFFGSRSLRLETCPNTHEKPWACVK